MLHKKRKDSRIVNFYTSCGSKCITILNYVLSHRNESVIGCDYRRLLKKRRDGKVAKVALEVIDKECQNELSKS